MLVGIYNDHIAYTLETNEKYFSLGNRVISRMNHNVVLEGKCVKYNGNTKIMYGLDNLRALNEVMLELADTENISLLKCFLKLVKEVAVNDYLNIDAVDVNCTRMFYDTASKELKCVVLPIQSGYDLHEGLRWQEKYRNTLALFCSYIFQADMEKYSLLFHEIMDPSKTNQEITEYLLNYDFGIQTFLENEEKQDEKSTNQIMTLEHNGEDGNIIFRIWQKEYVIGKSVKKADGTINFSSAVSRRHCVIKQMGNCFTIMDLESSNGTWVNGFKLDSDQNYILNDGDTIQLADVTFFVRINRDNAV